MKWLPNPIFLPGEIHGQRSLVGYTPWDRKEVDPTGTQTIKKGAILESPDVDNISSVLLPAFN